MAVKKKRKATPAQLRALAKGRATAARNRKRKAPKRKRVVRRARNPARGNYQKARAVARGVNPVRSTYYVVRQAEGRAKGMYFTGDGFSKTPRAAVLFQSPTFAKRVAQKLADRVGASMSIKRRGEK